MAKLDLNRVRMPKQKPEERVKNFKEVALGYTEELAVQEAKRCLQCPTHPCIRGCPVNNDIPGFIKAIKERNFVEAVRILKKTNALPGICGRVCPQEKQCEFVCTLAKKNAPIAIGALERFVGDWARAHREQIPKEEIAHPTGKKVAVVGSGPAGLTCAAELAKMGYRVTIFDALHCAGGVLMYGIPEFRLPKQIVQEEVDYVLSLGVEIRLDTVVGRMVTVDELLEEYDAVFLGTGAGLPMLLNIPGENLNGIYTANEFLTRINLMKAYLFPEYDTPVKRGRKIAIIGGGNVAMDAARCAKRIGYEEVYVVYRRSKAEMPARLEEVENAEEEGIIFKFLTNPKRFIGNEKGWVKEMECYEMTLGEPDASGRRKPIPKPGSEFTMEIDAVVVALGTSPNPLVASTTPGLNTTKHGTLVADETTGKTTKERVWAGGDAVTGAATVISAMGAGKRAAAAIDEFLRGSKETHKIFV
ncbi:MAG: NADPH-dependent glutamate synthase [Thermoplasmata archaeon]